VFTGPGLPAWGSYGGGSSVARTFSLAPHNPRQRNWRELWHGGKADAGNMDGQGAQDEGGDCVIGARSGSDGLGSVIACVDLIAGTEVCCALGTQEPSCGWGVFLGGGNQKTGSRRGPEKGKRQKTGTWLDKIGAGLGLRGRCHLHRTTLARGTGESCGTGKGETRDSSRKGKAEEGNMDGQDGRVEDGVVHWEHKHLCVGWEIGVRASGPPSLRFRSGSCWAGC
jgi:hypothetical protein